jgi:hypothetical protein
MLTPENFEQLQSSGRVAGLLATHPSSPLSNVYKEMEVEGRNTKVCFWRTVRKHANDTPVMCIAKISYDRKIYNESPPV